MKREWQPSTTVPALADDGVHLWRASLHADDARATQLAQLLAEDEAARAAKFVFARDRRRYVVARATLRRLLSGYLAVAPDAVGFAYEAHGKPILAPPLDDSGLAFNVSHSGDLAVFAFTRGRRVGVDVEFMRPLDDMHQVAATVFSPRELASFNALPPGQQHGAFYAGWTRKEAFIKALGAGMSYPLKEFDVTLAPHEAARLVTVARDPASVGNWQMVAFAPADDHAGALVVEATDVTVSFWDAGDDSRVPRG